MISIACIIPTLRNIDSRIAMPPDDTGFSPALENLHDGAMQVELGLRYLDNGKNPYSENYEDTPLRFYSIEGVDLLKNPALEYFVYLPGFLAVSFPAFKLLQFMPFPYDQRWIYLTSYIVLILVLPLLVQKPEHKLTLMAGVGLNPLLVAPVIIGMNDVLIILLLSLVALCSLAKRTFLASLLIGVACASKQSAWLVLPFYCLYLLGQVQKTGKQGLDIAKSLVIIVLTIVVIAGPFALWNSGAFVTDVVLYPDGLVAMNTPIRGYTLGVLLTAIGVIHDASSYFPFWLMQLLFGVPLLFLLLRRQWHENDLGSAFVCGGAFVLGLGFFSRFFHANYLGFAMILIVIGAVIGSSKPMIIIQGQRQL